MQHPVTVMSKTRMNNLAVTVTTVATIGKTWWQTVINSESGWLMLLLCKTPYSWCCLWRTDICWSTTRLSILGNEEAEAFYKLAGSAQLIRIVGLTSHISTYVVIDTIEQ